MSTSFSVTSVTPFPARGITGPRDPRHPDRAIRAEAYAVRFTFAGLRYRQDCESVPQFQAGWPAGADAESATGAPVRIDDGYPFV